MNIDWNELNKGFTEELGKTANWDGYLSTWDSSKDTGLTKGLKETANFVFTFPRMAFNFGSAVAQNIKPIVGTASAGANALGSLPAAVGKSISGAYDLYQKLPTIMDNVGRFAPLAMGALILPSLMNKNRQQQGAPGQPVVVNNYLGGQRPNILSARQGVNSLTDPLPKMGEFNQKKADVITEALATAAKRRMANKVLDIVSPEDLEGKAKEKQHPDEIEVVTKYPEIAKLLEDKENKAYLDRLIQN